MEEQFLKWLDEKGVKESFLTNCPDDDWKGVEAFDYVAAGFFWIGTPEGHKYWESISDEWRDHLKWEA